MRTIFITSFEGMEIKNILRTSILSTLLEERDIRMVLFTRSHERVAYHKREFNDSRISYEIVEKPTIRGLDKLLQKVKFMLLKTETTDLRRRMRYKADHNFIAYWGGRALNRICARKIARMALRFLDYHFIKNHQYDGYFETYKPSLVILGNLFTESETDFLRTAKKRGIATVGFINSWDKTTARSVLRGLPDKIIVFNDIIKDEVMTYNDAKAEDIFVGGMPHFDHYFTGRITPRDVFLEKMKLSPDGRFILYAPIGSTFSDSDWDMIDLLYRLNGEEKFGKNISIFVRFPPNDFIDQNELAQRPYLLYEYPGFRFSTARGTDWDMGEEEMKRLADTLAHMSLLIGYTSSIAIDAAIFDKPVINIYFEMHKKKSPFVSPIHYYQMTHYKKAFEAGGVRLVRDENELVEWVNRYMEHPSTDREQRQRIVREQCAITDGTSGERIGRFIVNYMDRPTA